MAKDMETTLVAGPRYLDWHIPTILRLELQGKKPKDICEQLGLTPTQVSLIRNSPIYKQRIKELQEEAIRMTLDKVSSDPVRQVIADHALDAAKTNVALMHAAESEKVRQQSAWDILDRAGYHKKIAVEAQTKTTHVVDPEGLKALGSALAIIGISGSPAT